MKNNGKVCDVHSLVCNIKILNGLVPGTWKWTFKDTTGDPCILEYSSGLLTVYGFVFMSVNCHERDG